MPHGDLPIAPPTKHAARASLTATLASSTAAPPPPFAWVHAPAPLPPDHTSTCDLRRTCACTRSPHAPRPRSSAQKRHGGDMGGDELRGERLVHVDRAEHRGEGVDLIRGDRDRGLACGRQHGGRRGQMWWRTVGGQAAHAGCVQQASGRRAGVQPRPHHSRPLWVAVWVWGPSDARAARGAA